MNLFFKTGIIFLLFFSGFSIFLNADVDKTYLLRRIPQNNIRYGSFSKVLDLMEERNVRIIVETGTSRSGDLWSATDGCSTLIFAAWAKENNALFYSVDIDDNALQKARSALGFSSSSIYFIHSDSICFLEKFDQPIDFLYLDSFDFNINNPLPSQRHHLKEIIAAYPLLKETSIVMIDDCDLPHGGKGKYAIQYLLERDWVIVWEGYQVILVKKTH